MGRKKYAAGLARACIESLESRTMLSLGTAAAVGFLPDYNDTSTLMSTLTTAHFEGLTQINYFSVLPNTSGLLPGTSVGGSTNSSTLTSSSYSLVGSSSELSQLVSAAHADGLKVDVVIGGAGSYSNNLGTVIEAGSSTWQTFAASVQQFANAHGIDGIDLDWEPASLGTNDVADYAGLIAALRTGTSGITISSDVNAEQLSTSSGGSAYELNATAIADLSTINVMAYDLDPGNVSPTGEAETDLANWGSYVKSNGGSTTELIFGMPFYGTSGTTWQNTVSETYGQLVAGNGSLPSPAANSVVIDGTTWNYNGPDTIAAKTAYSLDNGYGGVAVWEISQDYFPSGGGYDPTYSLLPQIQKTDASDTAVISGSVSSGGSGVAGVTVYLDINNNGQLEPGDPSTTTGASGTYTFSDLLPGTYEVREVAPTGYTQTSPASAGGLSVVVTNGQTASGKNFNVAPVSIANEYLFYYGSSAFDGSATSPSSADQNAIATDKSPLLPGQTATFANVSSYIDGINGILIDFGNEQANTTFSASDFQFAVGNNSTPSSWAAGPTPSSVATWIGTDGDTFADIVWPNGTIRDEWLQVTVLADAETHLASPDVFYFGSLVGATGASVASTLNGSLLQVTSADVEQTELHLSERSTVPITNLYDFDRNGQVTSTDVEFAELNLTEQSGLELISLGGAGTAVIAAPKSKGGNVQAAALAPSAPLAVSSDSAIDDPSPLLQQNNDLLQRAAPPRK
jgi:hypothetical protein